MEVYQDPSPPPSTAAVVKKVFKCDAFPAVIAAAAIARAAGVTVLETASSTVVTSTTANINNNNTQAEDGAPPRKQPAPSLLSCPKVTLDEKENIDPVTGLHARLASGAAAAPRVGSVAEGTSRSSSLPSRPIIVVFFSSCNMCSRSDSKNKKIYKLPFKPTLTIAALLLDAGGDDADDASRDTKGGVMDAAGSCVKPNRPPLADITAAFITKVSDTRLFLSCRLLVFPQELSYLVFCICARPPCFFFVFFNFKKISRP